MYWKRTDGSRPHVRCETGQNYFLRKKPLKVFDCLSYFGTTRLFIGCCQSDARDDLTRSSRQQDDKTRKFHASAHRTSWNDKQAKAELNNRNQRRIWSEQQTNSSWNIMLKCRCLRRVRAQFGVSHRLMKRKPAFISTASLSRLPDSSYLTRASCVSPALFVICRCGDALTQKRNNYTSNSTLWEQRGRSASLFSCKQTWNRAADGAWLRGDVLFHRRYKSSRQQTCKQLIQAASALPSTGHCVPPHCVKLL